MCAWSLQGSDGGAAAQVQVLQGAEHAAVPRVATPGRPRSRAGAVRLRSLACSAVLRHLLRHVLPREVARVLTDRPLTRELATVLTARPLHALLTSLPGLHATRQQVHHLSIGEPKVALALLLQLLRQGRAWELLHVGGAHDARAAGGIGVALNGVPAGAAAGWSGGWQQRAKINLMEA